MGPVPSPATCPTPQTPSCLLHPPASALPLTRGSPRGRQDDSGEGFPRERVCFMPGRRTCPAPEHLLSPLQKKNPKPPETGGGGHNNSPPPRASCATTAGFCGGGKSQKKSTGDGFVVPTDLGVASALSVSPTRPAGGRARALPRRVSALSPRGPSVRAARRWLCPTSTATFSTRTGPGISSRRPGWSGFGAGRRRR